MSAKRRSNDEWLELYERQCNSGMTMKKWCLENDINHYTMADRMSRLRKLGLIESKRPSVSKVDHAPVITQDWARIELTESSLPVKDAINITVGSFIVTVSNDFHEATFVKVCRALSSIC
jgi:hypothetical protein